MGGFGLFSGGEIGLCTVGFKGCFCLGLGFHGLRIFGV